MHKPYKIVDLTKYFFSEKISRFPQCGLTYQAPLWTITHRSSWTDFGKPLTWPKCATSSFWIYVREVQDNQHFHRLVYNSVGLSSFTTISRGTIVLSSALSSTTFATHNSEIDILTKLYEFFKFSLDFLKTFFFCSDFFLQAAVYKG